MKGLTYNGSEVWKVLKKRHKNPKELINKLKKAIKIDDVRIKTDFKYLTKNFTF